MFVRSDQRADQLKAQDKEKEKNAHDFARPALGQPALQPGEQHARQNDVHEGKGEEHDRGPGKQRAAGRLPMPMSIPSSHRLATAVAGSSDP